MHVKCEPTLTRQLPNHGRRQISSNRTCAGPTRATKAATDVICCLTRHADQPLTLWLEFEHHGHDISRAIPVISPRVLALARPPCANRFHAQLPPALAVCKDAVRISYGNASL